MPTSHALVGGPIETGPVPDGADFDAIVVGGGPGGSAAAGYPR